MCSRIEVRYAFMPTPLALDEQCEEKVENHCPAQHNQACALSPQRGSLHANHISKQTALQSCSAVECCKEFLQPCPG